MKPYASAKRPTSKLDRLGPKATKNTRARTKRGAKKAARRAANPGRADDGYGWKGKGMCRGGCVP